MLVNKRLKAKSKTYKSLSLKYQIISIPTL